MSIWAESLLNRCCGWTVAICLILALSDSLWMIVPAIATIIIWAFIYNHFK